MIFYIIIQFGIQLRNLYGSKHCIDSRLLRNSVKYRTEYRISLAIRKIVNDASACRILIENAPVKINAPIRSCRGEALGGQNLSSFFTSSDVRVGIHERSIRPVR